MPYTKADLQDKFNLSESDVVETLKACGLSTTRTKYSDSDIDTNFEMIRSYFDQGLATDYTVAADLFKQQTTEFEQSDKLVQISELLTLASEQVGTRISLTEAIQILDSCGLPDKDEYTSLEGDRFLEACKLIKQQNKSYEEVAKHFGIDGSTSKSEPDDLQQHLVEQIGGSAIAMDEDLLRLVNKITAKQASGTNIRELVRQAYLINLSRQMTDNQDGTDTFFAEVEERVMAQIEGKNRARSLKANWEWAQNSLTTSSPKQMSLPEDLDNGTSGD